MPQVEVLRPFNERHDGGMVHPGAIITVTDTRRDELKRLGLARDPVVEKAAPDLGNKMAPVPTNKVDGTVRRGPGRPAKAR